MSYGVVSPAMFLLCEAFTVENARRDHVRYVDEHKLVPRFFAQHRRTVLEAALFEGRDKVRARSRIQYMTTLSSPRARLV